MASDVSARPIDVPDARMPDAIIPGVPPAPTQVRAVAGDASVRLTWLDGAGATALTGDIVTGSDGQVRSVAPDEVAEIIGLVNEQAYAFTVAAVNSAGSGPASAPTVPVTPHAAPPHNRWLRTPSMPTARDMASAVRLRDGRVLAAGGESGAPSTTNLSVCEIYDPAASTWTTVEAIGVVGTGFGLTLLTDGRVLRTGGFSATVAALASTELFAPETGRWTQAVPMGTARFGHSAVLLADGRVLLAGGATSTSSGFAMLASAELYDPTTGQWSTTGSLAAPRSDHGAVRLLDGRVLVVGGDTGLAGLATAELYDPATGSWTGTGAMSGPRTNAQVGTTAIALLPSGDVLVAGGFGAQGVLRSAEVYRVATGTWQPTGDLIVARQDGFAQVALLDGRVLVAGGGDDFGPLPYAELYDELTGTWTRTNDLHLARGGPSAALLADGRVLLVGGIVPAPPFETATAEIFSPL